MRVLAFLKATLPISIPALLGSLLLGGWALFAAEPAAAKPRLPAALQVDESVEITTVDGGAESTTATITIWTVPYTTATVFWGKKLLGKIVPGKPLVIVRPRDSGPLDLMVRSGAYMPVQTRAHTFSDSKVVVKLTKPDKKSELLGYRIPLDAGPEGGVDGGVPYREGGLPTYPPPAVPQQTPPTMF